ncbi:MAG: T9SS type A sorting domain-containing protein, partial [Vicingaceae bacterium]
TGVWTPGTNDWDTKRGSLNSITNETNVRFKFAFDAGGGNNLYLDDINIDGTLSIEDKFKNVVGFSVYPNPTSSSAKISFNLVKGVANLTIKVRNAVGQIVTDVINGESFDAGKYTLNVDQEKKLSSGLYFIEFNADDKIQVQKLIVR